MINFSTSLSESQVNLNEIYFKNSIIMLKKPVLIDLCRLLYPEKKSSFSTTHGVIYKNCHVTGHKGSVNQTYIM